jgi:hypothetical protein
LTRDKVGYHVGGIIALASGSRRLDIAKARLRQFLGDADVQQGEPSSLAQKLRDQLGQELHRHQGAARQFVDEVIGWLDHEELGRDDGSDCSSERLRSLL